MSTYLLIYQFDETRYFPRKGSKMSTEAPSGECL